MKKLEQVFNRIMSSDMFRLDGESIDLPEMVIELCRAVNEDDREESKWFIGDGGECYLIDFITGAYWSFTEWHGGQHSIEYRALSALGGIFNPGMSTLDRENTSELAAYEQCNKWFENRYKK